jgi:formylglycine-generating enzyme required for sulfatase activity
MKLSPMLCVLFLLCPAPARAGQVGDGQGAVARGDHAVDVPAGPFTMGSDKGQPGANPDEAPAHRPVIRSFRIDRHEVTNRRYRRCVEAGACTAPISTGSKTRRRYFDGAHYDTFPVLNVTWYQAQAFCRWDGGRLPTEAEWEKAARGPRDRRAYPWGDRRPDCSLANFGGPDGCGGDTAEVGTRPAGRSPYGAHDMAGNVWEWVSDWYDSSFYRRSPARDPQGPRWGSFKVMRGGCFDTAADGLRVSCRNHDLPTSAQPNVGFRCARVGR